MNCLLLLCLALICGLIDASTYTIQVGWQAALDANDVPQWYSLWFYPTTLTIVYGDIVHWHFATREIHNVVFTNGTRQTETEPNGVNVTAIAGVVGPNIFTNYELTYSSGFRAIGTDDYSLTFNPTAGQGSFAFYCSIHGGMDGVITVLPRGSTAPLTPSEVADQQAIIINGMIEDAVNQTAHIDANKPTSGPQVTHTVQPDGTVNWVIGSGQMSHSGGGMQMYARFLPEYVEIQINDTITWSIDGDDPHWVFFSRNAFPPLFHGYDPLAGQPMNASTTYVNAPYKLGITWFNGPAPSPVIPLQTWPNSQGYINSGLMFGPNGPPVFPKSITVRFTESGTFPYVCPIHADLDMYGEVVVKPRGSLLCSTPGNLATCGRVGSQVRGDPQFVGLLGQSFQVHGIDGGIYNLITDDDIQVNSKFTFISESEVTSCPSFPWKFAGLSQAISCWSHDGSYLSQIGVMDNQGNRLSLIAGSPVQGFSSIELNNQQVNPSNNEPINQGKLRVTVFSSHHIEVVVDEYTLLIENSDNFLNLASVYVAGSRWSSMSSHGLLGQTWHRPIKSAQKSIKHIEGDVDDYLVNGGDLFGTDFMYNRFTKA